MTYERSQLEAAIRCGLAHALTDREMAAQLHLGPSTISQSRADSRARARRRPSSAVQT